MDARKLTELLRATIDPAQQKEAEGQLNQVWKFASELEEKTCLCDFTRRKVKGVSEKECACARVREREKERGRGRASEHL